MNKADLIKVVAAELDMPQYVVTKVVDAVTAKVIENTTMNEETNIGFLRVKTIKKPGRDFNNPLTGKQQFIEPKTVVKLVPCKALKDAAGGVK